MPQNFKRLGSINPAANTQTNVYVVPAATEVVISTITVCNQGLANQLYSIAMMTDSEYNASAPDSSFIVRDVSLPASDTIVLTIGLTANAGSILTANTSNANISFNVFGSELT